MIMDSLLCDEVLSINDLDSPDDHCSMPMQNVSDCHFGLFYTSKEDFEQACVACIEKESSYMPQPGYVQHLMSKNLVIARFRAIQWLIKCRGRLNISFGTVFSAANYFDRFMSMNQCHDWQYWMVELLSIACLSVASKVSETFVPSIYEIQMEGLDHLFEGRTIQRMELTLLHTLGWRLSSTTTFSYIELLITSNINALNSHLCTEFPSRLTMMLLEAVLDSRLLEFRPSIVAVSAIWCILDELPRTTYVNYLSRITKVIHQDRMDDLLKCRKIMSSNALNRRSDRNVLGLSSYGPLSPDSVLDLYRKHQIGISDCHVDLSLFSLARSNSTITSSKKRKREDVCTCTNQVGAAE